MYCLPQIPQAPPKTVEILAKESGGSHSIRNCISENAKLKEVAAWIAQT